jgi:hypothetical protein
MNAPLYPPDNDNRYGGIIDDFQTALKWKPILPLLQKFEHAMTAASKVSAIIDIAEFIAATGFNVENPRSKRWNRLARRFAVELSIDPELRDVMKDLLK